MSYNPTTGGRTVAGEDRPASAFILSAIGLGFQAIGGLYLAYAIFATGPYGFFGGGMMGPSMMFGWPWMTVNSNWYLLFAILGGAEIALGVLGVLWMNTPNLTKIRTGSTLVLVASIIAFPTMFGFMIGSLLMLIGSILGLTWQPR